MATVIDGSASVTINNGAVLGITSATAQASTSGTSIDFTGLPSWVKRITVMFSGVSTNGNSPFLMQIGNGSFTTSGYSSCSVYTGTGSGATALTTTGFVMMHGDTGEAHSGTYSIFLLSGNVYVGSGVYAWTTGGTYGALGGGNSSALSGALDRVRITTVGGTNTFDAGTVNIMYEG
jgi:hypothetical protein